MHFRLRIIRLFQLLNDSSMRIVLNKKKHFSFKNKHFECKLFYEKKNT